MNVFLRNFYLFILLVFVSFSCNTKQKKMAIDKPLNQKNDEKLSQKENHLQENEIDIKNWIGIEELVGNSKSISYKQDKSFLGTGYKDVIYLGVLNNNKICTLHKDGTIKIIDALGVELKSWLPHIEGNVAALAVDELNEIYVLSSLTEKSQKKIRGKSVEYETPIGISCVVFNQEGELIRSMKIDALKQVMGVKLYKDRLVISDSKNKQVGIFNKTTGEFLARIDGMRPCGDILDLSISTKGEILIGNLGSFRVEVFDMDGKRLGAFGERGKKLSDFHGCCNPVNLTSLKMGAIVTVEKFPTRIKLFSKNQVSLLPECEDLIRCKYMPLISDGNDNLYVGAGDKGLIKFVALAVDTR